MEALIEMPGHEKFMMELVIKKWTLECKIIELYPNIIAILSKKLAVKKKDPGAFIIPCTFGASKFNKALCDLGAN